MITAKYTAKDLREKYFRFFEAKGHTRIPSASLIPENDPTVLFTTAGMHPLVPYLLGETHPGGQRVVSAQKCIRTDDIDEVGDAIHHTFFEMLGNWSFGDYFKEDAIKWSWEFLTDSQWLGIDKNRLAISIFAGDADAPLDEESKKIWLSLGVPAERIAALPKKDNWWGPAGQTGPCGPDTEMFYWASEETPPVRFDAADKRWVEIWNDVFMQYNKKSDGTFEPLKQQNVDTGMGLERTLAVLNGYDDNYRTELFWPIIEKTEELSGQSYAGNEKSFRIIADHIRAAVMLAADGVAPANVEHGYVLRRLLRRAIRHGRLLGIDKSFLSDLGSVVGVIYDDNQPKILPILQAEEAKFNKTLEIGLQRFKEGAAAGKIDAFELFATYGFPLEMTKELAREQGMDIDEKIFYEEFNKHQELSRTAAAGKFAGGLADHGEMAIKYHTATHLLHAALRQILGKHVEQKGSNITAERLRFDFSHTAKMTAEEIKKVEDLVNAAIAKDYPVSFKEMTVEEAKKLNAMGFFESKYADIVKVYTIGDVSREICGGPHVEHTGGLGKFKIQKEEASSSGIRRIKAILE